MDKVTAKLLYYYDGPMLVAFLGGPEVILGLVALEDIELFYGPVMTAEELLEYLQGSLDLHTVCESPERVFRKVRWDGAESIVVCSASLAEFSEKSGVPEQGAYYMLAHRESGRSLCEEVRELIINK